MPVAFTRVVAAFMANLLCCMAAVAFTSALMMLPATICKFKSVCAVLLVAVMVMSVLPDITPLANSFMGPSIICADTPPPVLMESNVLKPEPDTAAKVMRLALNDPGNTTDS